VERTHLEAHRFAHAPHLPIPPLADRDLEGGALRIGRSQPHLRRRAHHAGLELDPLGEAPKLIGAGLAVHQHPVHLAHPVTWVHEVMGQVAIVGEHQQAAGVGVQPSDREQARTGRQVVAHGAPPFGIAQRGHHAHRLVEHQVAQCDRSG
jgi:hypothetical protein